MRIKIGYQNVGGEQAAARLVGGVSAEGRGY